MTVYFYENNGDIGILIVSEETGNWIFFDNVIDGIEITRENTDRIAENFRMKDRMYVDGKTLFFEDMIDSIVNGDNDFQTVCGRRIDTLMYGDIVQSTLCEYYKCYTKIYDSFDEYAERLWAIQHGE